MEFSTLSVVCGTAKCNANCPYCVSKMTGAESDVLTAEPNWKNLLKACRLAEKKRADTVLITGKGEPTLSAYVSDYVKFLEPFFPLIELQTNGIGLAEDSRLPHWHHSGMTLVCLSITHYDNDINQKIMRHSKFVDIWKTVDTLHEVGLSVRLSCTVVKGGIDTFDKLEELKNKCKESNVEQLTLRDVAMPEVSANEKVSAWVKSHQVLVDGLSDVSSVGIIAVPKVNFCEGMKNMFRQLTDEVPHMEPPLPTELLRLPHGAVVYDWSGQNVCLNNCLTENVDPDKIRQLIYFPNGSLKYSWSYEGAVIL